MGDPGFHCCRGSVAAHHGTSRTRRTFCLSWGVGSGTPTPIIFSSGSGLYGALPTADGLYSVGQQCHDRTTILNAHAPSTHAQYESKWRQFSIWCEGRTEDPVLCPVSTVLELLQSLLDGGLKVHYLVTACPGGECHCGQPVGFPLSQQGP